MNINISTKKIELTDKERLMILEKFGEIPDLLKRYNPSQAYADVKVQRGSRYGYKISFSMHLLQKKHIYAEVKNKKFVSAVTDLRDTVERQIKDYKEQQKEKYT
jgi:ribosome-associated translation inhibitor RaiA